MKDFKGAIAILVAVVMIFSFAACSHAERTEKVTQLVTNENGEPVLDNNGELATETVEAEVVTDKKGNTVTEVVTKPDGKPVTTVSNGETVNVTQAVTKPATTKAPNKTTKKTTTTTKKDTKPSKKDESTTKKKDKDKTTSTTKKPVKKPSAPKNVTNLKASDVKEDSLTISWSEVKCTGYQIDFSDSGNVWTPIKSVKDNYDVPTINFTGLNSYTKYYFRVRAYNSNSAGAAESKWAEISVTTKAKNDSRKIKVTVTLPSDSGKEDTLVVSVKQDGKYEAIKTVNVVCDGSDYTFTTSKKYKGKVTIKAELKNAKSAKIITTDKDSVAFDLSKIGIVIIDGEDD